MSPAFGLSRRSFLKSVGVGTAAMALPPFVFAQQLKRKPNIVYILADDLGYGDLSCYGQKVFQTPNIDRIASEGVRFTDHYSGNTVCAPSRCCLMTGLHSGHAQVRGNRGQKKQNATTLAANTVTIPKLLRQAGYVTGMFGKWGLGETGTVGEPLNHFDAFFGYTNQMLAHNYYPQYLWRNRDKVELDSKAYSHDLIMQAAMDFIRAHRDESFFCYLPVTIPHASMAAPEALHEKYRKLFPQFDNAVGRYAGPNVQNPIAAFPAMMECLDTGVGQVMSLLKELGLDDNTLVIFTSDNGPHHEGGHDPEFWDSNGPFRGIKRDLYEGGIRVLCVARWPGNIAPGTMSDLPCAFWDMLPTFCDIAGLKVPDNTDGLSILPEMTGKKQTPHGYLYWEFNERGGDQALRKGHHKAVRTGLRHNADAPIQLYDLQADPGESEDISGQHPEVVRVLADLLKIAHTASAAFPLYQAEFRG